MTEDINRMIAKKYVTIQTKKCRKIELKDRIAYFIHFADYMYFNMPVGFLIILHKNSTVFEINNSRFDLKFMYLQPDNISYQGFPVNMQLIDTFKWVLGYDNEEDMNRKIRLKMEHNGNIWVDILLYDIKIPFMSGDSMPKQLDCAYSINYNLYPINNSIVRVNYKNPKWESPQRLKLLNNMEFRSRYILYESHSIAQSNNTNITPMFIYEYRLDSLDTMFTECKKFATLSPKYDSNPNHLTHIYLLKLADDRWIRIAEDCDDILVNGRITLTQRIMSEQPKFNRAVDTDKYLILYITMYRSESQIILYKDRDRIDICIYFTDYDCEDVNKVLKPIRVIQEKYLTDKEVKEYTAEVGMSNFARIPMKKL